MSQNAERAKIIKHIRALSEQTVERGQSEAAANMAMDRISKLLKTFDLTMDEVMLGAEGCITGSFSTGGTKRRPIIGVSSAIAFFTDTKVWRSVERTKLKLNKKGEITYYKAANGRMKPNRQPGDTKLQYFGLESDVQMACYLSDVIQKTIDNELLVFKKSDDYVNSHTSKLSLTASFQEAMAGRIAGRLRALKYTMVQEVREARPGETDLVPLKKAKIEEEFLKTGTRLVTSSYSSGTSWNAGSRAGQEAGERVNLGRPIASGGQAQLLLK